jgi:AraC-like DNA-binding protein
MKNNNSINAITFEKLVNIDSVYTVHSCTDDGYVDITLFPFLPGIFVTFNDVHTTVMPTSDYLVDKDVILINYCVSGRCEFRISDNDYRYVKDTFTSVGSLVISDSFYYPSAFYQGFEIYIYKKLFTDETFRMLEYFHIDIDRLYKEYECKDSLSILKTDIRAQRLWTELYEATTPDKGLILLNLMKILYLLTNNSDVIPANTSYLTREQAKLAKEVHSILTEDISRHIPMREIALRLNTSESSLKNYFYAMFGMSVSKYMKKERLKKASALLTETRLPISDIAVNCGFSNQGRFAKIFKEEYGSFPLEYRRKSSFP